MKCIIRKKTQVKKKKQENVEVSLMDFQITWLNL